MAFASPAFGKASSNGCVRVRFILIRRLGGGGGAGSGHAPRSMRPGRLGSLCRYQPETLHAHPAVTDKHR